MNDIRKNEGKKPWRKRIWRIIKKTFIILFFFQLFYIILLKWVDPPITITQLHSWLKGDGLRRDYVNRKAVPPHVKLAIIAAEDQLFPDHNGFDWKSIRKAMKYNQRKPGRVRGASTISQQVAKNVFLWQGRSWFRKALEGYFTFMIELLWGKKRILQVYLNVVEMGEGIFGIEICAKHYFKKSARSLSRHEAALIAACLPNPKHRKPQPATGFIAGRARTILQQISNLSTDPDIQRVIGIKPP